MNDRVRMVQRNGFRPQAVPVPKRVAVCIPSHDMLHADFAMALAALCYNPGSALALINMKGSLVVKNRNNGVAAAVQLGVDYVLFLDSDMVFPMNLLRQLIARDKDIVGATYVKRIDPYGILGFSLDGKPISDQRGCVEVKAVPAGALLVRMEVFEKLQRPFFQHPLIKDEATGELVPQGEDLFFCDAARAAGFSVWCDFDLSHQLGHIGQWIFRIPDGSAATASTEADKSLIVA